MDRITPIIMKKELTASEMGKKGNRAMKQSTTPEQRKAWAKKGGWPKGRSRKSNDLEKVRSK